MGRWGSRAVRNECERERCLGEGELEGMPAEPRTFVFNADPGGFSAAVTSTDQYWPTCGVHTVYVLLPQPRLLCLLRLLPLPLLSLLPLLLLTHNSTKVEGARVPCTARFPTSMVILFLFFTFFFHQNLHSSLGFYIFYFFFFFFGAGEGVSILQEAFTLFALEDHFFFSAIRS